MSFTSKVRAEVDTYPETFFELYAAPEALAAARDDADRAIGVLQSFRHRAENAWWCRRNQIKRGEWPVPAPDAGDS